MTLAKVSDRNSFRANQNYSDSFQYLYPSQCELFRTNPKNVFYLIWWKTVKNRFDLIQFNPRQLSESKFSIRFNATSDSFGLVRINNSVWINQSSDWFGLKTWNQIGSDSFESLPRIKSDRFLTVFNQTKYKTFFELVRNDSHWIGYRYRNESE